MTTYLCFSFPYLKAGSAFLLGGKDFERKNKCEAKSFLHVEGPMPKGMEHFHRSKQKSMEACTNQYIVSILICKHL